MLDCLIVGLGGFIGTVMRYLIGLLPSHSGSSFPIKTLIINVTGAFVIGLIAAAAAKYRTLDPHLVLLIKVGICGGFTTFSTFAYESVGLIQKGEIWTALAYVVLSVGLGFLAVVAAELILH
jgi:CrcB protein